MIQKSGPDKIGFIEGRRAATVAGKGKLGTRSLGARKDQEGGHLEAESSHGPEEGDGSLEGNELASFDQMLARARRLVALELDLAETRRRLAEDNLKITEAQLELAEREIAELKAENDCLRGELEAMRRG